MILTPTEARHDLRRSPALRRAVRRYGGDPDRLAGLSAERIRETLRCVEIGIGATFGAGVSVGTSTLQFPSVTGLQLRLAGYAGITTRDDGGTLFTTAVADQSANGRNYAEATPAEQPQHSGQLINGVQAIGRWNGAHTIVQSAGASITQTTYTMYLVANFQDTSSTQFILDYQSGRAIFAIRSGFQAFFDGAYQSASHAPTTGNALHVWKIDGGSSVLESDGTTDTISAGAVSLGNSSAIGCRFDGVVSASPLLDCIIGELALVADVPSGADDTAIRSYLNTKWGLS